jgi:amino acid transporter
MAFFVLVPAAYNYGFARLLLVAGIDQRLPVWISRLNKYRVPAHAILFQATVASVFATVFFLVVPYLVHIGNPADLTTQVYTVDQASATLVWSISTAFLFFNLAKFLRGGRALLLGKLVAPQWILWICVIVGPLACLATIIDTLFFSWTRVTKANPARSASTAPVPYWPSSRSKVRSDGSRCAVR